MRSHLDINARFEILLLERGRIKGEFSGIVFIDVLDRRRADIGLYRGTWQQKQKGDLRTDFW